MHMIARLPCDDLYNALNERREFDAADYVRRLAATAAAGTVLTRNAAVPSRAVTIDRDR